MTGRFVKRRRVLATVGTFLTASLAGFSGGEGSSGPTERPSPSPTSTPSSMPSPTSTEPSEEGVEHYERAVEVLVANKEQHDEWVASGFEADTAGNFFVLRDRLETARGASDVAEAAASSSDFVDRINHHYRIIPNRRT